MQINDMAPDQSAVAFSRKRGVIPNGRPDSRSSIDVLSVDLLHASHKTRRISSAMKPNLRGFGPSLSYAGNVYSCSWWALYP